MDKKEIGGSLVNSFIVCKRQAWMGYHAIEGDKNNDYLRQGTYIHERSYERQQKGETFGKSSFDTLQTKEGKLIVGEVKKSSACLESARLQLAYYLYLLKEDGLEAIGQLKFPEERRVEEVELTPERIEKIEELIKEIQELVTQELPPKASWKNYCETCSYSESCWA